MASARHGAEEIAAPQGRKLRRRPHARPGEVGTAEGRCHMTRDREGGKGRLKGHAPRKQWLPQRGVRGCRGQGAAQAPVPCRLAAQATKITCLDEAAVLQRKEKSPQGRCRPSEPPGRLSRAMRGVEKARTR